MPSTYLKYIVVGRPLNGLLYACYARIITYEAINLSPK